VERLPRSEFDKTAPEERDPVWKEHLDSLQSGFEVCCNIETFGIEPQSEDQMKLFWSVFRAMVEASSAKQHCDPV